MHPRLIKNLTLTALSLLLTLSGVEIYLRVTSQRIEPTACRTFHPTLHHFFIPNTSCRFKTPEWDITYSINSLGLRDREYTAAKPQDTYRILMLGDSFTEGYGTSLDQTFVKLLEQYLNADSPSSYQVFNAGVSSWSPTPEYLYLKFFGLNYQPDLVILNLTISDFGDEYFYDSFLTPAGKQLLEANPLPPPPSSDAQLFLEPEAGSAPTPTATSAPGLSPLEQFKAFLRNNLKLYRFFSLKFRTLLGLYSPITGVHQADIGDVKKDQMAVSRQTEPIHYRQTLAKIESRLDQIRRLLNTHQVKFLLVFLPHPHLISGSEWSKGRITFGFQPGVVYSTRGFEDLKIWANASGVNFFDLTPTLKTQSPHRPLYFTRDGHLNPTGHQAVAQAFLGLLSSNLLK